MTTLVTGATGFVGQLLTQQLRNVCITTRNPQKAQKQLGIPAEQIITWNPSSEPFQGGNLPSVEAVVNLMGESIAEGRWNSEKKQRIRQSRVEGTTQLVRALIDSDNLPGVFVSASAIGIYGDPGEAIVAEDHPHGSGFLPEVCEAWESATAPLSEQGVRVVHLRIGIVLGMSGGALQKLSPLFRLCLGGRLGTGKQWMSWIHVRDLVSMIVWAIDNPSVSGPVNATAPNPVRNAEFTKELAQVVGRPAVVPVPRIALRLALGEFANSLYFSQRVMPEVALQHGFRFEFPDIRSAIVDALHDRDAPR